MVSFFRYAFASKGTRIKRAINLSMGSEGAIRYQDAMEMSEWELSYSIEVVTEILEERHREVKRRASR